MLRHFLGHVREMLWLITEMFADRIEQGGLILVIGSLDEHVRDFVVVHVNSLCHDKGLETLPL